MVDGQNAGTYQPSPGSNERFGPGPAKTAQHQVEGQQQGIYAIVNQSSSASSSARVPLEMENSAAGNQEVSSRIPGWVNQNNSNNKNQQPKHTGWFNKNTRTHRAAAAAAAANQNAAGEMTNSDTPYRGGKMETDGSHAARQDQGTRGGPAVAVGDPYASNSEYNPPPQRVERIMKSEPPPAPPSGFVRIQSWLTQSSAGSLHDFDESEWTPKDSSYGAAIPVAGWIPKNTRRLIEYSLIAIVLLFFVYLVVATSIQITDDNAGSADGIDDDNAYVHLDDDYYNVSKYSNDDDYSDDNNYNLRRRFLFYQQQEEQDDRVNSLVDYYFEQGEEKSKHIKSLYGLEEDDDRFIVDDDMELVELQTDDPHQTPKSQA